MSNCPPKPLGKSSQPVARCCNIHVSPKFITLTCLRSHMMKNVQGVSPAEIQYEFRDGGLGLFNQTNNIKEMSGRGYLNSWNLGLTFPYVRHRDIYRFKWLNHFNALGVIRTFTIVAKILGKRTSSSNFCTLYFEWIGKSAWFICLLIVFFSFFYKQGQKHEIKLDQGIYIWWIHPK